MATVALELHVACSHDVKECQGMTCPQPLTHPSLMFAGMGEESNWVEVLGTLGLSESEYEDARVLMAGRDSSFRLGMLGGTAESNKRVILKALRKSSFRV